MENMNISRYNEILAQLTACSKETYQRAELLPELLALQKQLVHLVFNGTHAESGSLRIWDVEQHLAQMNESCNHPADAMLDKVTEGCKTICNLIKSEFSGHSGEHKAFRSMDTIRNKKAVLHNVELQSGEHRTELDGIIFTESAIFIIEVKNTKRDILIDERGNYFRVSDTMHLDKNIGERMNEKAYLLREALVGAGIADPRLESIVVFTNTMVHVENNYPYINTCFLPDMPHFIEQYTSDAHYTEDDIHKMVFAVETAQCHEAYPLPLDVPGFKRDFASLLTILETSIASAAPQSQAKPQPEPAADAACFQKHPSPEPAPAVQPAFRFGWMLGIGAFLAAAGTLGVLACKTLKR